MLKQVADPCFEIMTWLLIMLIKKSLSYTFTFIYIYMCIYLPLISIYKYIYGWVHIRHQESCWYAWLGLPLARDTCQCGFMAHRVFAACPLRSSVATCYVLHSVLHHGVGLRCAGETITSPQCTKGAFSEDVIVPHQHTHMLHQIWSGFPQYRAVIQRSDAFNFLNVHVYIYIQLHVLCFSQSCTMFKPNNFGNWSIHVGVGPSWEET